jgi:hypothetical protein
VRELGRKKGNTIKRISRQKLYSLAMTYGMTREDADKFYEELPNDYKTLEAQKARKK